LAETSPERVPHSAVQSPSAPKVGVRISAEHVSFSPGQSRVDPETWQLHKVTCVSSSPARQHPRSGESPACTRISVSNSPARGLAGGQVEALRPHEPVHANSRTSADGSSPARDSQSPARMSVHSPARGEAVTCISPSRPSPSSTGRARRSLGASEDDVRAMLNGGSPSRRYADS